MENVLEWHEETIAVPVLREYQAHLGATKTLIAQVLGDWAYHPLNRVDDPFRKMGHCDITHVPTGHSLTIRTSTPDEARRIVEALQGVTVDTYAVKHGVLATLESRIAILERIIPVAKGMRLGINAPGDTSVRMLREAVKDYRRKLAERHPEGFPTP